MEWSSIAVIEVNFLLIAILPFVFFRRDGKFTLMWCLTALPYVIALLFLIRTVFVEVDLITELDSRARHLMQAAGAVLSCASVGMILMTIGSHRVPLALWHQDKKDDEPAYIVTWGSYKYIRHPFYSAFVLAWIAGALVAPTGIMLGLAGYACSLLVYTARKEERRLANEDGQLGQEYRLYMKRTGRFLPRVYSAI